MPGGVREKDRERETKSNITLSPSEYFRSKTSKVYSNVSHINVSINFGRQTELQLYIYGRRYNHAKTTTFEEELEGRNWIEPRSVCLTACI